MMQGFRCGLLTGIEKMNHTLNDTLGMCFPNLSTGLVDSKARQAIKQTARLLPAITRTLLECRLSANQNQVDLSQSFVEEDKTVLQSFFYRQQSIVPGWGKTKNFIGAWLDEQSLISEMVAEIWFEFDLDLSSPEFLPVPGVFLSLKPESVAGTRHEKATRVLEEITNILLENDATPELVNSLKTSVERLPENVSPNYIGIMSSRKPASIRAQFSAFPQDAIVDFLKSIGLENIPDTLQSAIDMAYRFFKSAVLCIDLAPNISNRIGLELFPAVGIDDEDLTPFIDFIVSNGFCSPEKREGLLSWPGRTDPTNCPSHWPDPLIIESFLRPADQFSVIDRRINHFKLVCEPGHPVEVKAYLAFDHQWASYEESGPISGCE